MTQIDTSVVLGSLRFSVLRGREAGMLLKDVGKIVGVFKSYRKGDLGDVQIGV